MNWVYSLQYLFYHLLNMARAVSRIWIHLQFKIDKIKFEANSHLILDAFPPVFLSDIISIATNHSSDVMVNTTFPVMDEVIRGFKPSLNLYIRIVFDWKDMVEVIRISVLWSLCPSKIHVLSQIFLLLL